MKKHNFSAGPCILPKSVMLEAAEAVQELNDSGLSLIEISHRSPDFVGRNGGSKEPCSGADCS